MENIDILKEIKPELERFNKKFEEAFTEQSNSSYHFYSKKYASLKRAALDLKNELTKLTQDSKYKYQN